MTEKEIYFEAQAPAMYLNDPTADIVRSKAVL